jgi:hypothetical protein
MVLLVRNLNLIHSLANRVGAFSIMPLSVNWILQVK